MRPSRMVSGRSWFLFSRTETRGAGDRVRDFGPVDVDA